MNRALKPLSWYRFYLRLQTIILLGCVGLCSLAPLPVRADTVVLQDDGSALEKLRLAESIIQTNPHRSAVVAYQVLNFARQGHSPDLQIHALSLIAKLKLAQNEPESALRDLLKAFSLIAFTADSLHAVDVCVQLAQLLMDSKQYERASNVLQKGLTLAKIEKYPGRALQLHLLAGDRNIAVTEFLTAVKHYEQALFIAKKMHDRHSEAAALAGLGVAYRELEDNKQAIDYSHQALLIYRELDLKVPMGVVLEDLASSHRRLGDFSKALEYAKRSLALQQELGDRYREGRAMRNLASVYRKLASYENALKYANGYLSISEDTGDIASLASANNEVGLIYTRLKDYEKARNHYLKTLSLPEDKVIPKYRAVAFRELGVLDFLQGQYQDALKRADQAQQLFLRTGSIYGASSVNRTIGRIYLAMGENAKSMAAFKRSYEQALEVNNKWAYGSALAQFAQVQAPTNPKSAEKTLLKALAIGNDIASNSLQLQCLQALSKTYMYLGNFREAFKYSELSQVKITEISSEESKRKLAEIKVVREIELREQELEKLRKQAMIRDLKLSKQTTELEIVNQENRISHLEIERSRYLVFILIGAVVFVVIGLGLVILLYRLSKQKEEILNDKNQQIAASNENLAATNAAKDRFFSIIAHDLRNPISALESLAKHLDEEYEKLDPPTARNYISNISRASEQVHSLLMELLEWASAQLKNTDPMLKSYSLYAMCLSVVDSLHPLALTKNISLVCEVDEGVDVLADKNMVKTVIRNLVSNAIKFTPENGSITLFGECTDNSVTLHVKDSGVGLLPEDMEHLFDMGVEFSKEGTAGEKGSGLGLSLCKELVTKNSGKIYVSSDGNHGSDFYFTLPISSHSLQ